MLVPMKKLFKWFGIAIVGLVIAIGSLTFGARYHDGPLEIFAGGPFKSGEILAAPNDWNVLRDRQTVEFQTLEPPISRTIWLVVYDGRLFFTSGYMKSAIGSKLKRWPYQLERDNRIILRIDGKLYEQRLLRITSGPDIVPVLDEFDRKYGDSMGIGAAEVTEGYTWMYEVAGR